MARTGQHELIARLRGMTQAGTADYTVAGVTYWNDDQLAVQLDAYAVDLRLRPMLPLTEYEGGTARYFEYRIGYGDLEGPESGSVYFAVRDDYGSAIGTADYTVDTVRGVVRFVADQGGSARYFTGRAYNLNASAAGVWREKAASVAQAYSFSADNHRFSRSDMFKHYMEMARYYGSFSGIQAVIVQRADMNGD